MAEKQTVLITGGAEGLGGAAAKQLAHLGMQVVIADIHVEKGQQNIDAIREATGNPDVYGIWTDLSTHQGVKKLADEFTSRFDRLDVLLNNVGGTFLKYKESADGLEYTWALNYLGHFQLTHLLLPLLQETAKATQDVRIIEMVSSTYRSSKPDFTKRPGKNGYNGVKAYAYSKRALMVFMYEMADRLGGTGIHINAITPGWVKTHIAVESSLFAKIAMSIIHRFMLPVDEGVAPVVFLATSPAMKVTGGYFKRYASQPVDPTCANKELARQLWEISEKQLGTDE